MVLGKYQQQINKLPSLPKARYENIFRLYTTPNNQYFYNILQSIQLDGEIDPKKVFYMTVRETLPWSIISYNAYGNTDLWWLIALINNVDNPVKNPEVGKVLKIIRPEFIGQVVAEINNAIQS